MLSRLCLDLRWFSAIFLTLVVALFCGSSQPAQAQTFDSGSTGADGTLTLTTPGTYDFYPSNTAIFPSPVDPEGDNIYHFTTITIGSGVILRLSARHINAPVFWLASGAVQIDGTIDLNGELGQTLQEISQSGSPFPSVPGAGGYPGGVARFVVRLLNQEVALVEAELVVQSVTLEAVPVMQRRARDLAA